MFSITVTFWKGSSGGTGPNLEQKFFYGGDIAYDMPAGIMTPFLGDTISLNVKPVSLNSAFLLLNRRLVDDD